MKLIYDWKQVLTRAWSMRLLGLSILFGAAELALPFLDGVLPVERGFFAILVFATNIAAAVSRLVAQRFPVEAEEDEHERGSA
jgi:hypothetical protein